MDELDRLKQMAGLMDQTFLTPIPGQSTRVGGSLMADRVPVKEGVNPDFGEHGDTCHACGEGTYGETSIWDDMDGVLHCNKCRNRVEHGPGPRDVEREEWADKMDAKRQGIHYHEGIDEDSRMSDGMTGQEFDFEMEPDYITILRHNEDTGVTIPMDNWDAMVRAYTRIVRKGTM